LLFYIEHTERLTMHWILSAHIMMIQICEVGLVEVLVKLLSAHALEKRIHSCVSLLEQIRAMRLITANMSFAIVNNPSKSRTSFP
jgi:hypothetical protein